LASEEILRNSQIMGIKSISLRFFNVIGVNSSIYPEKIIGGFPVICTEKILRHEAFEIFRAKEPTLDDTCSRDYVDVQDVSLSIIKSILFLQNSNESICEILNIGSSLEKSTLEIVRQLESLLGLEAKFTIMSSREESSRSIADIDKAKRLIDWSPTVNFNESLNSIILNLKAFE
jgi:UDP-glucose 4-epimerase